MRSGPSFDATAPGEVAWRRILRYLGTDVRPGEGATAWLLFAVFFLLISFQYATKSVRQSTFLEGLGSARLPLAYLAVALLSLPMLWIYSRVADRLSRHRLIVGTCLTIALSLVGCWWLFQFSWSWLPFVFYVWISIVYVMTVSQFWSFTNHVLDSRQAKRLFGFIGAGGLLGGVAGGQVARTVSTLVDTRSTFLVAAGLLVAAGVLVEAVHLVVPRAGDPGAGAAGLAKLEQARGGFQALRGSKSLQSIALVMILTVMVAQLVDLQFNWAAEAWTHAAGLDRRTAFFGNFFSIMGISALVFQLLFTARIHRFLGIGFAMRLLPLTLGAGTMAMLLTAAMFPVGLISALYMLKIGENGLRYSLDQVTRELLFFPVASSLRVKAKAYIDVFVQRGAKGLAGLILLLVTFGVLSEPATGWISLGLIALWLLAVGWAFREYVRSFRRTLGQLAPESSLVIDLDSATTLELLVQSLGSSDRRHVLYGLELLEAHGRAALVPPLLLYHDDPEVRRRTLHVLAAAGRRDAVPLIEKRLGDDDPDVRAAAVGTLAELFGRSAATLMLPRLGDTDPGVRAAAVACLGQHGDDEQRALAAGVLGDMLAEADARPRIEGAKAIGGIPEPAFDGALIQLLYDAEPQVAREAIAAVRRRALRDGFNPAYLPTLVALLDNRRLKHDAREALVALGAQAIPALAHFLGDPQESPWVRRALPKTLAGFRTREAAQALLDALERVDDVFLRHKLIQALATFDRDQLPPGSRVRLESAAREEVRHWLLALGRLAGLGLDGVVRVEGARVVWSSDRRQYDLLYRLLVEETDDHLRGLFGVLALLHAPGDVWAAHRGLTSGHPASRTHALEYLDNVLSGELRRMVFLVIGDDPPLVRLRAGVRLSGVSVRSREETLAAMLDEGRLGDMDGRSRALGALHTVYLERIAGLYPRVEALVREGADRFVRETAAWIANRVRPAAAVD